MKEDGGAAAPDSAALAFTHMPDGASLLPPAAARPGHGILPGGSVPDAKPGLSGGGTTRAHRSSEAGDSPYGCYLASRPLSETVGLRSIYLHFPASIVEAAGTSTHRFSYELWARTNGQGAMTLALEEPHDMTAVRYANCIIPEAEEARELTTQQLLKANRREAAREAVFDSTSNADATPQVRSTRTLTRPQPSTSDATTMGDGKTCIITEVIQACEFDPVIVTADAPEDKDTGGGGGDSGGDSGDGGSGGGTTNPFGGGGGSDGSGGDSGETCTKIDPPPGSDCAPPQPEPAPPEDLCVGDPVINPEIRPTPKSGIEGGRYGPAARGAGEAHWGIDVKSDVGDPLYSMTAGTVWAIKNNVPPGESDGNPFGNYVIIEMTDPKGEATHVLYAHLNEVTVDNNVTVFAGQKLGKTGKTGNARGVDIPHVHIETRKNDGTKWNEFSHFDPEEQGILASSFGQDGKPVSPKRCQ